MLADMQSSPRDEPTITLNTLFKVDRIRTRSYTYNFKERVPKDETETCNTMSMVWAGTDYLGLSRKALYASRSDAARVSGSGKIGTIIQISMWETLRPGRREKLYCSIKQLKTLILIENDDHSSGRTRKARMVEWLSQSQPLLSLEQSNGAPGDVMFRRTALWLLAAKGYHEGFVPLMFLGSITLKEAGTVKGRKTWDERMVWKRCRSWQRRVLKISAQKWATSWAAFKEGHV